MKERLERLPERVETSYIDIFQLNGGLQVSGMTWTQAQAILRTLGFGGRG